MNDPERRGSLNEVTPEQWDELRVAEQHELSYIFQAEYFRTHKELDDR